MKKRSLAEKDDGMELRRVFGTTEQLVPWHPEGALRFSASDKLVKLHAADFVARTPRPKNLVDGTRKLVKR